MNINQYTLFLAADFPEKMSGLENSLLKRFQLFEKQLGITPIYITCKYDLNYPRVIELFKKLGKISENFQFVNLYNYYQSYRQSSKTANQQIKNIPYERFYHDKKVTHSICYNERGKISHINYYNNKGRTMLENFDRNGHRSRAVLFNPENKLRTTEIYYRIDGSVCFIKQFKFVNDKAVVESVWIYNEHGIIKRYFESEEKFNIYLLEFYLDTAFNLTDTINIIGDCRRNFLYALDQTKIAAKLKRFYVFHSFHLQNSADMNSKPRSPYFFLNNLASSQIDKVLVLSPQQQADIADRFGSPEKLVCIPHSINYQPEVVPFASRNPYKVVAAGRLVSEKRFDVIIHTFAKVVKKVPQATLEIFGHGDLKDALQALIEELNLTNNVFLRDFTHDIYAEFTTAKCFLMNSDHEGQPLVILESLSSGCPVVATDFRYGPAMMIESGKNGFVVEKNNEQIFADKVIEILTNPKLAETLSANAYQSVNRFSEEAIAPLWRDLLNLN